MPYRVTHHGRTHRVRVEEAGQGVYRVSTDDRERVVDVRTMPGRIYSLLIDGRSYEVEVDPLGDDRFSVLVEGEAHEVEVVDERRHLLRTVGGGKAAAGRQVVASPIPGKVVRVMVKIGDRVRRDQGVVVVEAMKMQNELRSPADGVVREVTAQEGRPVEGGAQLVVIEGDDA